jgi:hypothetical protein
MFSSGVSPDSPIKAMSRFMSSGMLQRPSDSVMPHGEVSSVVEEEAMHDGWMAYTLQRAGERLREST